MRFYLTTNGKPGPAVARFVMLALAIFALALPIVGPLDDHHFAERSHAHGHVYLNGYPVNHEHTVIGDREHLHIDHSGLNLNALNWAGGPAVAYFTDQSVSLMLTALNAPYHSAPDSMRSPPPKGSGDSPLSPFAAPQRQPDGARLSPPLRPPIA